MESDTFRAYIFSEAKKVRAGLSGDFASEMEGRYLFGAEQVRQVANHEGSRQKDFGIIARILDNGSLTKEQITDLWIKAGGDPGELKTLVTIYNQDGPLPGRHSRSDLELGNV